MIEHRHMRSGCSHIERGLVTILQGLPHTALSRLCDGGLRYNLDVASVPNFAGLQTLAQQRKPHVTPKIPLSKIWSLQSFVLTIWIHGPPIKAANKYHLQFGFSISPGAQQHGQFLLCCQDPLLQLAMRIAMSVECAQPLRHFFFIELPRFLQYSKSTVNAKNISGGSSTKMPCT